eukprot:8834258-Lingulodinium_polyedra.AAC.1
MILYVRKGLVHSVDMLRARTMLGGGLHFASGGLHLGAGRQRAASSTQRSAASPPLTWLPAP